MGLIYAEQLEHMSVDQMQDTHENEIKLLNKIEKLIIAYERGRGDEEELSQKIDKYVAHVKKHFANEEELMEKYDFPSYEMHKIAHDMFLADLESSLYQWKEYGDIKKIIYFIRKTPEWIVMHVNSVDAATADFLYSKMKVEK